MERAPDGSRVVFGKATDDALDLDDQIVDPKWAARALKAWFDDWANVRQMHSPLLAPAGKAVGLDVRKDGVWSRVKVVEPTAVRLVDEGVYKAFSIGIIDPEIVPDPTAAGGRIVGGIVNEISLVDYPANTNCLPAGAAVVLPQGVPMPLAASGRHFVGDLVTVRLASGHKLAGTPKHPVATRRGWVPLAELHLGDDVLCCPVRDGVPGVGPDVDDVPTRIEEFFESGAVGRLPGSRFVPRAEDFHGDGAGSEVAVVRSHGLLDDDPETPGGEEISEPLVLWRRGGGVRLPHGGTAFQELPAGDPASRGFVRGGGKGLALLDRHPVEAVPVGLGLRADADPAFPEATVDSGDRHREGTGDLLASLAGKVTTSRVVAVDVEPWSGHVYNLQTETGWYFANGIVTHNCKFALAKRAPSGAIEVVEAVEDAAGRGEGPALASYLGKLAARDARRIGKVLAAGRWYAALKRNVDPNVGGGVDRDALPASAFVFPKTRDFPVVSPGDVDDAVSSWGRYKGSESFDTFKKRLTTLARKKGDAFEAALPESWKEENKMAKAKKGDAAAIPDGHVQCPTCKGGGKIRDGKMDCPKCAGAGHVAASDAKGMKFALAEHRAAVAKRAKALLGKDADDDVDDAIASLMDDLAEAAGAQTEDLGEDAGKPSDDDVSDAIERTAQSVSALAAAQAEDQAADMLKGGKKKGSVAGRTEPGGPPASDAVDPGDGARGVDSGGPGGKRDPGLDDPVAPAVDPGPEGAGDPADRPAKKKGKGKKSGKGKKPKVFPPAGADGEPAFPPKKPKKKGAKEATVPKSVARLHDWLCPALPVEKVKAAWPKELPTPGLVDPGFFAGELAALSSSRKKLEPDSVGAAYQAFAAANRVSALALPDFHDLRAAATRKFMDAYPDASAGDGLSDPERFRRPYLPSAAASQSSTTRVPTPDLKDGLRPDEFRRGPLTDNQARANLYPGSDPHSVARKDGGRYFYTNAGKDEAASAMGILHDHIASRFPGICPLEAAAPGTEIDRDGLAGSPAEMLGKAPALAPVPTPSGSGAGTLSPAGKSAKAKKGKAARRAAPEAALTDLVAEATDRATRPLLKRLAKAERKLGKAQKQLSRPDPRTAAVRGTSPRNFTPKESPTERITRDEASARVAELRKRVHSRNSDVAGPAIDEMRRLVSPQHLAHMLAEDD